MFVLKLFFMVLLTLASSEALARPDGTFYGGLKAGSFVSDIDGLDNAFALGARIGYDYGRQWSLELDFLTGEYEAAADGLKEELDGDSLGVYVTYRSPGAAYYIIRFGWIDLEIAKSTKFNFKEVDNIDFSYGLGAGLEITENISLELEYTLIESKNKGDINIAGFTLQRHF